MQRNEFDIDLIYSILFSFFQNLLSEITKNNFTLRNWFLYFRRKSAI